MQQIKTTLVSVLAKRAGPSSNVSLLVSIGAIVAAALLIGCAGKVSEADSGQGGVVRPTAGSTSGPYHPPG